jgi:hypothetical protein
MTSTVHRFPVIDMFGSAVELVMTPEGGKTGYVAHELSNGEGFAIHADEVDRYCDALAACAAEASAEASHEPPRTWRAGS